MNIFNEGNFEQAIVGEILQDGGDSIQARQAGGAKAAFAGYELIMVALTADDERLDDPVGPNGIRQFLEMGGVEDGPGLKGIWDDVIDGNGQRASVRAGFWRLFGLRRSGGRGGRVRTA